MVSCWGAKEIHSSAGCSGRTPAEQTHVGAILVCCCKVVSRRWVLNGYYCALWWKSKTPQTFSMHGLKKKNPNIYFREQSTRTRRLTSVLCFLFLQNATLKELNVCRGDTLVITEGKLPAKVKQLKLCSSVTCQCLEIWIWESFIWVSFSSSCLFYKYLEKFWSASVPVCTGDGVWKWRALLGDPLVSLPSKWKDSLLTNLRQYHRMVWVVRDL